MIPPFHAVGATPVHFRVLPWADAKSCNFGLCFPDYSSNVNVSLSWKFHILNQGNPHLVMVFDASKYRALGCCCWNLLF